MEHPQQKPRRKILFLLLLVLSCAALLATGTYAAYTSYASVKQVALARTLDTTGGIRFSSLYLYPLDDDVSDTSYLERTIGVTNTSEDLYIDITVCNYPQGSTASFNDKDISYTFDVTFPYASGIDPINAPGSLQGGKPSTFTHTIIVPQNAIDTVSSDYITVVVTPDEASKGAAQGKKLAAKLKIVPMKAAASGWTGQIMLESDKELSEHDAINYYIHGTEECYMILSWGEKIDLGQWSRKSLDVDEKLSTNNSVTIHVGGSGQPTSYYLQFYRKQPASDGEIEQSLGISFTTAPTTAP